MTLNLFNVLSLLAILGCLALMTDCCGCSGRFASAVQPLLSVVPGPVRRGVYGAYHWVVHEPNPLFQAVYLLLVGGGYIVYVFLGLPQLPGDSIHQYMHVPIMLTVFSTFYAACTRDPGVITKETLPLHAQTYKHDEVIFLQGNKCSTCLLLKPARSKHCRICDHCVARFDHHCVWVNSCVGGNNYFSFLVFLLTTALFCLYGAYVFALVLLSHIDSRALFSATYQDQATGRQVPVDWFFAGRWVMFYYRLEWGLCVLASVMGVVLTCFFGNHLFLAMTNQTTNERAKRGEIQHYRTVAVEELAKDAQRLQALNEERRGAATADKRGGKASEAVGNEVEELEDVAGQFLNEADRDLYRRNKAECQRLVGIPKEVVNANLYYKGLWENLAEVRLLHVQWSALLDWMPCAP